MFNLLKISDAKKQIEKLEGQIEAYKKELNLAEGENNAAKDFATDLQGMLAEKDVEISQLQSELEDTNDKVDELETESISATQIATDIIASCGASEPVEKETQADKTNKELVNEFTSLTDPAAKVAFYSKHRDKLINKN